LSASESVGVNFLGQCRSVHVYNELVNALVENVSAVIFDFFGTLTLGAPAEMWTDHASQIAAVMGVEGAAVYTALNESFPERATGSMGDLPQTLQTLASRLGVRLTAQQLDSALLIRRQFLRERFTLRQDAMATIDSLRMRGFKIGVLSDCSVELPDVWHELPLAASVDAAVFSCMAGIRKPDPSFYALVTEQLAVAARDCLYVGDGGGHELTGARAVGMRVALLASDDWRTNSVYDREEHWDGPRISCLAALCL
jgi:putative hydrolase of the HAD superfamily